MGKKIANISGIILAMLLSVLLLFMLIITPIFTGATSLFQDRTLYTLVEKVDFTEFFPVEEENAINPMSELMKTEVVGEFVKLYVQDLLDSLDGKQPSNLTLDALNGLKEEYKEELVGILRDKMLEGSVSEEMLTDEAVQKQLDELFDATVPALLEELPTLEELGVEQEVLDGIILLRNNGLNMVFIVAIAILSLLILCCRWPQFKGFIWLAVVYLIASLGTVLMRNLMSDTIPVMLTDGMENMIGVIEPILSVLKHSMSMGMIVYLVLAVVFVTITLLGRKKLKKKV